MVYRDDSHHMAVVVDAIQDIIQQELKLEDIAPHHTILGASIIGERLVDIVDVPGFLPNSKS